ncbi:hypothetical protein FPSE_06716 [Fusarium pseudograminearum CS3096]|uniref:Uncharacterized protein n=1 Tax=Fusarium pseudograminearum (strain CS3096) TaxID=1028729 RepID=K3VIU4_FUSPC|nr:hypothetical protein FPSE_06716 [Fusarium pseudograminearum CS3096]EKJ73103.1 hypothetical protein FPSE_06716 [Fusarium pseudograminearum CS3096]
MSVVAILLVVFQISIQDMIRSVSNLHVGCR